MSKRKSAKNFAQSKKSSSPAAAAKGAVPRGTDKVARTVPLAKGKAPKGLPAPAAPLNAGNDHDIEIIARGCLLHGSYVLLCRNVKHGYCYLPGGHVEFSESAAGALAREFLEESGVRVRVGELALVSEGAFPTKKRWHHEINLVFHVEQVGGTPASTNRASQTAPPVIKSREDWIDFAWIELAAIPETDIRPVAAKAWLATLGGTAATGVEWVSELIS